MTESVTSELARRANEIARRVLDIVPDKRRLDWGVVLAARWQPGALAGRLIAAETVGGLRLDDLLEIDYQKAQLLENTRQFVAGYPANNALLWGARGTGKSSLIHALLTECAESGLRLIEVDKEYLVDVDRIVADLADEPYRFIVVCDDLSFEAEDPAYKALKSALEGSVVAQSRNVLIYATSNRRHLLPEHMTDNTSAQHIDGELHEAEAVEEKISLSDRFGLWLSFYPFKQNEYVAVTRHWTATLARQHALDFEWTNDTELRAKRWALARGVRSGRTAQHFARDEIGRLLLEKRGERR